MNNSTMTAINTVSRNYSSDGQKNSDTAPMVVTRLSGWIDVGEAKGATPSWIIQTQVHRQAD